MTQAAKKTGSVLYFEPLKRELQDCLGALKDVSPDQIFSNRKGMEKPPASDDSNESTESDAQPGTSISETSNTTSTKKPESNKLQY